MDGRVWKCTLCYDRLKGGHEPACAKACPTDSIQFGPLDELRERAEKRLEKLQAERWNGARLYGHDPDDGVGGFGAFFLLLDDPEVYGLPRDPVVTTADPPTPGRGPPRPCWGLRAVRPVIEEPVWQPQVPAYFFTGGLAGASSGLAFLARMRGNDRLADRLSWVALASDVASPALLIADLGRRSGSWPCCGCSRSPHP
jgi:hypothetical protein